MPKRKGNFNAWRIENLADPINAANYLNAALEDSPEIFLDAIKDVIQARTVSKVAAKANVTRESLYRSFSVAGNPTLETLGSVLDALGLKLSGVAPCSGASTAPSSSGNAARAHKSRRKYGRRGFVASSSQLNLPFDRTVARPASVTLNVVNVAPVEQRHKLADIVNIVSDVNMFPGFFFQQQHGAGAVVNAAR